MFQTRHMLYLMNIINLVEGFKKNCNLLKSKVFVAGAKVDVKAGSVTVFYNQQKGVVGIFLEL